MSDAVTSLELGNVPTRPLNEVKLLVVGQGGVGKTSLITRLVSKSFSPNEATTEGIAVYSWSIFNQSENNNGQQAGLRINIWDFGGQEIMHATHQFYLTKRSLYLLVLDVRLTQEENRIDYWLKIIQAFSGESPVLIVGNKTDQRPLLIDRDRLRQKYPNIVGIFETSAANDIGIEELRSAIATQANSLPHVHDLIPETWFTVKNQLENLRSEQNFITNDRYRELCVANRINDKQSQDTLIRFLHDIGVVLHFDDDPRLESLGILNPLWVTNGVYKILNARALLENRGILTIAMLNDILNLPEYPRDKRLFIVDMMKKFELCYDIESNKIFLVPDILPNNEPVTGEWDKALAFQYRYSVLPASIMTRFIVRMNAYIDNEKVWRYGAVLRKGSNSALVRSDTEDQDIFIYVDGNISTRRDFLMEIRNQFDAIHKSLAQLQVSSHVPLPDYPTLTLEYSYLLLLEKDGVDAIPVLDNHGTTIQVNVTQLLNTIESPETRKNLPVEIKTEPTEPDEQDFRKPTFPSYIEINKRTKIINDHPDGPDQLNYTRYAVAFADLITNPEMATPITIGIYGQWGSGKSFLMGKIKEEIRRQHRAVEKPDVDVHIIDFNAWVYSGSEHLWASLVTHLYRDIEKYFGVRAHWMRLRKAVRRSLPKALGVFAFYALLGLLLSLLLNFNEIQTATSAATLAVNAVGASVIGGSALASIPALWAALREFFDSLFLSRANKLQNLAAKPDFRNQIGIMADIKDEIKFIRELLKTGKNNKPTRLVLFIDDLDRCEHRKAVEVLQAIMLLLADEDGSPFVIFLGIDARVVVCAIEEHYGDVLVKAGINGYEYLDKIIQVPFVIPAASPSEIDGYVESLLWASKEEKDTMVRRLNPSLTPEPAPAPEPVVFTSNGGFGQRRNVSEPQLPTDAALFEMRQKAAETPEAPQQEQVSVTFTLAERDVLKACVADLSNNPRKIKRIINIYRLARLILPASIERVKAIRWILMTEQWPLHVAWIIELVENDAQIGKKLDGKGIADVYKAVRANIHAKEMETLLEIDADPELFTQFIEKAPAFSVQEIKALLPYTFNLNPAIRSEVSKQALKLTEPAPQPVKKPRRAKAAAGAKKNDSAPLPA